MAVAIAPLHLPMGKTGQSIGRQQNPQIKRNLLQRVRISYSYVNFEVSSWEYDSVGQGVTLSSRVWTESSKEFQTEVHSCRFVVMFFSYYLL